MKATKTKTRKISPKKSGEKKSRVVNKNGIVFYRGASLLNGESIFGVMTGLRKRSDNTKTGDALQTWIMREDINPVVARKLGANYCVCGNCPWCQACYVNWGQGPLAVWRCYQRAKYTLKTGQTRTGHGYADYDPSIHDRYIRGRYVRIGSAGDPVAIPADVWRPFVDMAKGNSGYTHQYEQPWAHDYRGFLMASADSVFQAQRAAEMGWRFFLANQTGLTKTELRRIIGCPVIGCPAAKENGARVKCCDCGLCCGTRKARKPSVQIDPHGNKAIMSTYKKVILPKIIQIDAARGWSDPMIDLGEYDGGAQ